MTDFESCALERVDAAHAVGQACDVVALSAPFILETAIRRKPVGTFDDHDDQWRFERLGAFMSL